MRNKRKSTMKGNRNTMKCARKKLRCYYQRLHCLLTCNSHSFHWTDARANIAPSYMNRREYTRIPTGLNMGTANANDLLKEQTRTRMQQCGEHVCMCVCVWKCECWRVETWQRFPATIVHILKFSMCCVLDADTLASELHCILLYDAGK